MEPMFTLPQMTHIPNTAGIEAELSDAPPTFVGRGFVFRIRATGISDRRARGFSASGVRAQLSSQLKTTSGMMQTFLTICLSAAFITTGESLSCDTCFGLGHNCKGFLGLCIDGDVCGTIQIKTSGVLEIEGVAKTCFHPKGCSQLLSSLDFGMIGQALIKITCCTGKECEKDIPPLPSINTTPNGKKCPACFGVNKLDCKGVPVECAGDNIYCVALRASSDFDNVTIHFAVKGCTNRDVCKTVAMSSDLLTKSRCVTFSGSPAASPGSPLLFLQIFSGLLLHKILF